MRTYGTLSKWNEPRGFGFVMPADGKQEVFVHVSAFPRDGRRPLVGEMISFDVEDGPDGKKRAANVTRPGSRASSLRRDRVNPSRKPLGALLAALSIGAIVVYGYGNFFSPSVEKSAAGDPAESLSAQSTATTATFNCDGRTHCSQMTSCAEATYFLQHCPNTKMDGNGDGQPCEQQWCVD